MIFFDKQILIFATFQTACDRLRAPVTSTVLNKSEFARTKHAELDQKWYFRFLSKKACWTRKSFRSRSIFRLCLDFSRLGSNSKFEKIFSFRFKIPESRIQVHTLSTISSFSGYPFSVIILMTPCLTSNDLTEKQNAKNAH